jgi:hypothetical protein
LRDLEITITSALSCFPLKSTQHSKTLKPEQQQAHARLEKLILVAALTCCAAMVYLASLSMSS